MYSSMGEVFLQFRCSTGNIVPTGENTHAKEISSRNLKPR
jgi:hypothetical protein